MRWSRDLAYVVGLFASDGCLYSDGRHMSLTSKDLEQINNFKDILHLNNKIGLKYSSKSNRLKKIKACYHIQFGNKELYKFFLEIGLTPKKSLTIRKLLVPDRYFGDFLRGCLDGDGCTYSYWDKVWPNSFVFYLGISSGSLNYLKWIEKNIKRLYGAEGAINKGTRSYSLKYAKYNSLILLNKMYYSKNIVCLSRKWFKIEKALGIISGN